MSGFVSRVVRTALFLFVALFPVAMAGTPNAVNDNVTVNRDAEITFDVLANDSGTGIAVTSTTQPAHGKLLLINGRVRYIPAAGYTGPDSFTYTITNGVTIGTLSRNVLTTVTSNGNTTTVYNSGYGSALARVPGSNDYYALTDRGPNSDASTSAGKVFPVPNFTPGIGRFTKLSDGTYSMVSRIDLKRPDGVTKITGKPNRINPLNTEIGYDLTGAVLADDPFGLDSEGLAIDSSGNFWISDEYGPFIVKYNASGVEQERINPVSLNTQNHKLPLVLARRRANRGMEGLCITPSGKLVGIMQNSLNNRVSGGTGNISSSLLRIVKYDPANGQTQQYVYVMESKDLGASEIACINENKFLVLERDGNYPAGSTAKFLFEIDITGATDISDVGDAITGKLFRATSGGANETLEKLADNITATRAAAEAFLAGLFDTTGAASAIVPVTKGAAPVANISTLLNYSFNHDKVEGVAILATTGSGAGETVTKLAVINDDDFGIAPGTVPLVQAVATKLSTDPLYTSVPDYNEIAEIDLSLLTTATATVNITVQNPVPQLVPIASGVVIKPLFTVGDSVNNKSNGFTPYRMVGIPDGAGAFNNPDGKTFTLTMNHELGNTAGVVREHGSKGSFVSKWTLNRTTLQVLSVNDLNSGPTSVFTTTNGNGTVGSTALWNRFCSGDVPAISAFFNSKTGLGTQERVHMNGEESGDEGRAFAHVITGPDAGKSFELPGSGKFSHENGTACPFEQDLTIVCGTDDTSSPGGQVYFYVGTKRNTGNTVEKAGLVGGKLFGVLANAKPLEDRLTGIGSTKGQAVPFTMFDLGDVSAKTGAQLQTASGTNVTQFRRPEDSCWDPLNPSDLYFVTTDQFDTIKNVSTGSTIGRTRLWRLRFTDITRPELGGTITMLIDGSENPGPNMLDNMTIDKFGRVILQEDIGGNANSGKIWVYNIKTGSLTPVIKHNPALFGEVTEAGITLPTAPFSNDEESSGIFDASDILGAGWFITVVQAHEVTNADTETVEGGQLLALYIPTSIDPDSSSSQTPYLVGSLPGFQAKAILSVGDTVNLKPDGITPYRMVGIPDGLGTVDNGDGTFTLMMNQELGNTLGTVRSHGNKGAFVSRWKIDKTSLKVLSIEDHFNNSQSVFLTTNGNLTLPAGSTTFNRFCSADLPALTAFFNPLTGLGTTNRLFLDGEEAGDEGRAFAHVVTGPDKGKSFELPHLGKMSFENAVANPFPQNKTIVMVTDDTSAPGGQVYMYLGDKGSTGTDVEKAGLRNGNLYAVFANGVALEDRTTAVGATKGQSVPFTLTNQGNVSTLTGAALQATNVASVTQFRRPEDGSWDPNNPKDFYFVTTDQFDQVKNGGAGGTTVGRSRLWRLSFSDLTNPTAGGTITLLIDGSEDPGPNMMDNITVDTLGRVVICEDPGNQAHSAKVWVYTLATGSLVQVAQHDPKRFGDLVNGVATAATAPFSKDEESSGVIDASNLLGKGWYLIDVQAHEVTNADAETVEGGQLLAIFIPPAIPPQISAIANQVTNEDTATGAIAFTVTAGCFPISTVTAVSSNKTLVPDASAVITGTTQSRTIKLTPAADQNGETTLTLTATDSGGQTVSTTFKLVVQPVADLPVITSAATATPNPAAPAQSVAFMIAATGSTGIQWNFGDGSPIATGSSVTHAYTAAGTFNVSVKVTGTDGDSTATLTVVVLTPTVPVDMTLPTSDFDGDGIVNSLDDDDDNDGYSDKIETAMGGNSLNATVTPGNKPAITTSNTIVPRQVKLSIKLTFKAAGDALTLSAILPGSSGAKDAIVDVGGNVQNFTLTNGKSPKDKTKTLALNKDKLTMKLNKVTLAPDFADEGLTNATFSGEIINIHVSIITNGKLFEAELSKEYTAKGGKGSVK